ncbi:MAG: S1/P1 nuclease [Gammaproteobacteria bacterium]|nr:hypothetical protein [Gammaproteobacteria bacterium]
MAWTLARCAALLGIACASTAHAFGPSGHRIAGLVAEPLLCPPAADRVAELSDGEGLAAIGIWADRIRGEDAWRHTAPWHFMNIDDDVPLESYRHPPEGDVLWAIEHHAARLAESRDRAERVEALRFVVHFVVDLHQPLHVGRAADRGGNEIDVRYDDVQVSLHRFWDNDALRVAGLSERELAESIAPVARMAYLAGADEPPTVWAAESLALRPFVYGFRRSARGPAPLDDAYITGADTIVRVRLAQAAARLAHLLNRTLGC